MADYRADEKAALEINRPEAVTDAEKQYYASQWQLMWWKLKRHRMAVASAAVLAAFYFIAVFAPFFSPTDPNEKSLAYREAPPTRIHLADKDGIGTRLFVYAVKVARDRATFKTTYTVDTTKKFYVRFFVRGYSYNLLGFIRSDTHLFGTGDENIRINLFGADTLGRDVFARVVHGARISLSIGLVGVFISFVLGITLGGIAGYFGGVVDEIIQRVTDFLISIPKLPLWMGLSAALPTSWSVASTYFAITVILSLLGWTNLGRTVRGKFLSLREEEFVIAARLAGGGSVNAIFRHMLPSIFSHIIASLTLAIPMMIIGETSLSFLGLGMQAPAISWGVLLRDAQNVHTLALVPWQMIPGICVIIAVLAFNFLGDGLRDASDPYSH